MLKKLIHRHSRRGVVALVASSLIALLVASQLPSSGAHAQDGIISASWQWRRSQLVGTIAARGRVLRDPDTGEPSDTGLPNIVEYGPGNEIVRTIGQLGTGREIMPASQWDDMVTRWEIARERYERAHGPGSTAVISASAWPAGRTCLDFDGSERVPERPFMAQWVLVPAAGPTPTSCDTFVIAHSMLANPTERAGTDGSLIVDTTTVEILERTADGNVFAAESGFFVPRESADGWCTADWNQYDANGSNFINCSPFQHEIVWAPIVGVEVSTTNFFGRALSIETTTDFRGRYQLPLRIPQLPNAMYIDVIGPSILRPGSGPLHVNWIDNFAIDIQSFAEMRWDNFNPRTRSSRYYFLYRRDAHQEIIHQEWLSDALVYSVADYRYANFAVDAVSVRVRGRLTGLSRDQIIPLADPDDDDGGRTSYEWTPPASPDELRSQGLVEQISARDLADTDVYVFRAADMRLVGARWGISPEELSGIGTDEHAVDPECAGLACVDFNIMLRGPMSRGRTGGTFGHTRFDPFSSAQGTSRSEVDYLSPTQPFTDFLRPDDGVYIYLVNRVTGYVGGTFSRVTIQRARTAPPPDPDADSEDAPLLCGQVERSAASAESDPGELCRSLGYCHWQRFEIAGHETFSCLPGAEGTEPRDWPANILVDSHPTGARVTVNGTERGYTPLVLHLPRRSDNQVVIHADGYEDALRAFDIPDGPPGSIPIEDVFYANLVRQVDSTTGAGRQLLIGGVNGVRVDMAPPNLRVTARRVYDVTAGSHIGERRETTLGTGGAGATSDEMIEVTTEWLDDDDGPLPPDLPGYTGRIARVVGEGELRGLGDGESDTIGQFAITPGLHTQVIHIPQGGVDRAHYYVHVDGAPAESVVDWSGEVGRRVATFDPDQVCYRDEHGWWSCRAAGAASGPLTERPAVFVPFLVQRFDRGATLTQTRARLAALREAWTADEPTPVLDAVVPVYRWLYAPEYQFSLYDVEVDEVSLLTQLDPDTGMGSTSLRTRHTVSSPDDDPLQSLTGADPSLLFGVGYAAVIALVDEEGSVDTRHFADFPDIETLVGMTPAEQADALSGATSALTPDDLLALQIFGSGDRGQSLWEMDGALLMVSDAHPIPLVRRHLTATFDSGAPAATDQIDSWDVVQFRLFRASDVTARFVTEDGHNLHDVLPPQVLPPGLHTFIVDAAMALDDAALGSGRYFYLEIEAEPIDERLGRVDTDQPRWTQRVRHAAGVFEVRINMQTGQAIAGGGNGASSVLARDGSLSLERQDFVLPGVGPELAFRRTYSNLGSPRDDSALGIGWHHNWEMQLVGIAQDELTTGHGVPSWVQERRRRFFPWSEVPAEVTDPERASEGWAAVMVNGTEFRRTAAGSWVAERGRHGSLSIQGNRFVYVSEDGTRFFYPIPTLAGEVTVWEHVPTPDEPTPQSQQRIRVRDPLAHRIGISTDEVALEGGGALQSSVVRPGPTEPTPVQRIEDRNGNALLFEYEGIEDRISRVYVEDDEEREIEFAYSIHPHHGLSQDIRLDQVTGGGGVVVNLTYDDEGNLASVTRDVRSEEYAYEPEGGHPGLTPNLVSVTEHPQGGAAVTRYEYYEEDGLPLSVRQSQPGMREWDVLQYVTHPRFAGEGDPGAEPRTEYRYTAAAAGLTRVVVNPRGYTTTYTLNAAGNPVRIEEPLGRITELTWSGDELDEDNVLVRRADLLDSAGHWRVTEYDYDRDSFGRLIQKTETDVCRGPQEFSGACGNTVVTTYDPRFAVPLSRRDRNGYEESWTLDAHGNVLTHTDAEGAVTTSTYYPNGLLHTVQEPGHSGVTTYTYDAHGFVETVRTPEGVLTTYDHDVRGHLLTETDALGRTTTYGWDPLDDLTSITHPPTGATPLSLGDNPLARIERFTYDSMGHRTGATDRNGASLTVTYTARGQIASITRSPDGGRRTFHYDNQANLVSETDWLGHETTHEYDVLDHRIATVDRLGHRAVMTVDLAGRTTRTVDFAGRVSTHRYDTLGRLRETERVGGAHLSMEYFAEVDPSANLRSVTEYREPLSPVTTTFERDRVYRETARIDAADHRRVQVFEPDGDLRRVVDEQGSEREYIRDEDHRVTHQYDFLDGRRITTEQRYDAVGRVREVVDAEERVVTLGYDGWDREISRSIADVDVDGDPVTYTTHRLHDGMGHVVMERDGGGVDRVWRRDVLGRVVEEIDGNHHVTTTIYDSGDNPQVITSPRSVTELDYDDANQLTEIREAVGTPIARRSRVLARDGAGNPTRVEDSLERVTVMTYDANDRMLTLTPHSGPGVSHTYSRNGLLLATTDRRGSTTTRTYDVLNRLASETDGLEHTVTYERNYVGAIVAIIDPRQIRTEMTVDELGRTTEIRRDGVRITTREYDDVGNLVATIDARGNRTDIEFGPRDFPRLITLPLAEGESTRPTIARFHDGSGDLRREVDASGGVHEMTYDGEHQLVASVFAAERTSFEYDAHGNLRRRVRPEQQAGGRYAGSDTVWGYDALDRLVSVAESGLETTYTWDAADRLLRIDAPRDRDVVLAYDELDRLETRTEVGGGGVPDRVSRVLERDGEGAVLRLRDPRGFEIVTDVDALGRVEDVEVVGGPMIGVRHVHRDFDDNGNPIEETVTRLLETGTSVTETTTLAWDRQERLDYVEARGVRIDVAHDADGNRTSVATASGGTVYGFDSRSRLRTATIGADTVTFDYHEDGRLRRVSRPNGTTTELSYEATRRLDRIRHMQGGTAIAEIEYDYDHDGNQLFELSRVGIDVESTHSTYDSLDRLLTSTRYEGEVRPGESGSGIERRFGYTGYDRTTEAVFDGGSPTDARSYVHDALGQLDEVEIVDGAATRTIDYRYDAAGSVIARLDSAEPSASTYFDYDAWSQVVAVRRGAPDAPASLLYEYDAGGMRIRERGPAASPVESFWLEGVVVEDREIGGSPGALVAHYHQGPFGLLSRASSAGDEWYHQDGARSTVALTGDSGAATASYRYEAFGQVREETGSSPNRQTFTGHRYDAESGLVYMGARFYDPSTGSFLSADSYLGEPDAPITQQRYLYGASNPHSYWDPTGHANALVDAQASPHMPEAPAGGDGLATDMGDELSGDQILGYHRGSSQNAFDSLNRVFNAAFEGVTSVMDPIGTLIGDAIGPYIAPVIQGIADLIGVDADTVGFVLEVGGRAFEAVGRHNLQHRLRNGPPPVMSAPTRITGEASDGMRGLGGAMREAVHRPAAALDDLARAERRVESGVPHRLRRAVDAVDAPDVHPSRGRELTPEGARLAERQAGTAGACGAGGCGVDGGCFPTGTPVELSSGPVAIDTVELGARAVVRDESVCSHEARDLLRVGLVAANPREADDLIYVELLVTADEAIDRGFAPGAVVAYENPDFGISGFVSVSHVTPWRVEAGPGCAVIATIQHENGRMVHVALRDRAPLEVTDSHRIWSDTREAYVAAFDLWPGETIRTLDGSAQVRWVVRLPGVHLVHNIEVDGAHEYFAGDEGVLVHNGCPTVMVDTRTGDRVRSLEARREYAVHHSSGLTSIIETGRNGRIERVQADLHVDYMGRGTAPTEASRRIIADSSVDDAGHLIANSLGGSGGVGNIVPLELTLNRGRFSQFEGQIREALRARPGQFARADMLIEYTGDSMRPRRIRYSVIFEDGHLVSDIFDQ